MTLDDTGHRADFGNGAMRERAPGKGRYDLLPPEAIEALALVFEEGARKYSDRNWERGIPLSTCIDSGLRHLFKLSAGMDDEDHAALAMANMAMFIALRERAKKSEPPSDNVAPIVARSNGYVGTGWVSFNRCGTMLEHGKPVARYYGPNPHAAHSYGRDNGQWCDGYI
jgi:hypothetical protein